MYYRYKTKKSSGRTGKVITIVLIASVVFFLVYHFRSQLQFWKYSVNRLTLQIDKAEDISNIQARISELDRIKPLIDEYVSENIVSCDGYYLQARILFLRGIAVDGGDLVSFIIDNRRGSVSLRAKDDIESAIQKINKGLCFERHSAPSDDVLLMTAKAYFYIDYYSSKRILDTLSSVRNPRSLKRIEDRKFFGLMRIVGGNGEEGMQYLVETGDLQNGDKGKLFLASAYFLAKQYTNAIMEYKSVLENSSDPLVKMKAHMGLGRVYYTQSLAREALNQFGEVLKSDPTDITAKMWSVRSFLLVGDKFSAKKICQEILTVDKDNIEAAELSRGL
jgi:tetratricopeptide (TPR) repeat protein